MRVIEGLLLVAVIVAAIYLAPATTDPLSRESREIHRARLSAAVVLAGVGVSLAAYLLMRRRRVLRQLR